MLLLPLGQFSCDIRLLSLAVLKQDPLYGLFLLLAFALQIRKIFRILPLLKATGLAFNCSLGPFTLQSAVVDGV